MRPVSPRTGAPEVMVAEEQEEYLPLSVAMYADADATIYRVTRWTFSPEERAKIAAGEDVYICQLSFPTRDGDVPPMTPLMAHCGPADWMLLSEQPT